MKNRSKEDTFPIWRLFFIEASRNSKLIDGIGFFHAVMPFLKARKNGGNLRGVVDGEAAVRNLDYFNCNPMLAPFVIARIGTLENDIAGRIGRRTDKRSASESSSRSPDSANRSGEGGAIEGAQLGSDYFAKLARYKNSLSSSLTSVGDYFFEIVLVPLSMTLGTILALKGLYVGVVIFLALYNFYHFRLRIGSFNLGLEGSGGSGRNVLQRLVPEHRFLEGLLAFTVGVFSAIVFVRGYNAGRGRFVIVGLITVALVLLLRKKLSFTFTIILLFLALSTYLVV